MKTIKINHIAKIEGHASFIGKLMNGNIKEAKIETEEGARLVEGILLGRIYSDAPVITARICGICPVVHNLCSIKAMEDALKVKATEPTIILRKLMKYGEIIHSHGLHMFWLSLPDFYGAKDSVDFAGKMQKETELAVKVRQYGVDLVKVIGGRTVHPIASEVGGFKKSPNSLELEKLIEQYEGAMQAIWQLVAFFKKLTYPYVDNEKEFISQWSNSEYPVYDGLIVSDKGIKMSVKQFYNNIRERTYDESGSELVKRANFRDRYYMVGALARINNNYNQLNNNAKKVFKDLGLKLPIDNSFYNILAQVVEVAHLIEESKKLLDEYQKIRKNSIKKSNLLKSKVILKAGAGIAEVEAPRGMLFHSYELDKKGKIINCNIISPTDQLLDVIEQDIKELNLKDLNIKEKKDMIRFLIRAYDPCISCATH